MKKDQNQVYSFDESISFNESIKNTFRDALRINLKNPAMALFIFRTIRRQNKAARVRLAWEKQGVHVPPFIIFSITTHCNLQCKGCYARAQHRPSGAEMGAEKLRNVLEEARELGVSIVMIAGGEPLIRPEILDITKDFPLIIFPVFTNGLLISEEMIEKLRNQKNVVPVISLEGYEDDTDQRRGKGVYERLLRTINMMSNRGIFFGASLTLTRQNFATVTNEQFIMKLLTAGCKLFFFVDYVPVQGGTENLVLTAEQRMEASCLIASFRSELPGLFIAFPGDEEKFGGCLAAGRGFVHISPEGRLEPCPFSPFSDTSLRDLSLREALQSKLLRTIRESGERLSETKGGCVLWAKQEWVRSLLQSRKQGDEPCRP